MRLLVWAFDAMTLAAIAIAAGAACGQPAAPAGDPDAPPWLADAHVIDAPPAGDANLMPSTLADTGLCADAGCAQINAGIHAYAPRWWLWSDTATKRRWIYLPPGQQIDTSDMDTWHFPAGTKLWKEFTRDGVRVETRMYWKQGPDETDWFQMAYVWNAEQNMAVATPAGMANANGTQHDVPSKIDCLHCHNRTANRVLGFSALQLDYDAPADQLDLADLIQMNALSAPPASGGIVGAVFPLWPDASANDVAALGYLHANCAHCHNAGSDVLQLCPRIFKLETTQLASVAATDTYTTTVKQAPKIVVTGDAYVVAPADPDHSALMAHFAGVGADRMPPIATEIVDTGAQTILHDWIAAMPATSAVTVASCSGTDTSLDPEGLHPSPSAKPIGPPPRIVPATEIDLGRSRH